MKRSDKKLMKKLYSMYESNHKLIDLLSEEDLSDEGLFDLMQHLRSVELALEVEIDNLIERNLTLR